MADDPLFGIHGTALTLRSQRMALLASNIANAATPNYKARDFDFTKALATATSQANGGSADDRTAAASAAADGAMGYRVPLQTSLDGNTVELSTEQTMFAENAVQYKTTLSFLQGRVQTVLTALKGE
jgi:flagellar basal-body rod protein FlgB